ncbi:hypothetical protein PC9H_011244 [Pleurotus ostreatus]|uniref:Glyoxal oxidase n=1 Tax=Pleurotus ostreatus TaxID=5322 RepID=A0A8H6ZQ59_PLEOS|nr:uncharacterized protein PC9H_011244 [Pleurotus ostreatus]KAF7420726.1 hypothetical protein PC9H_011244 [Pleurotus ostreatus]
MGLQFQRSDNRPSVDPLQFNNHSALGALWDLKTSSVVKPLNVPSTEVRSGALLSNGTMVSVGGDSGAGVVNADNQAIRIFEPCLSPTGEDCTLFENLETHHLFERRWYASSIRIFDGSLMIVGGTHVTTPFYNVDPVNSFEFFPKKEGAPRPSPFLERSLPANLFPRIFALPDGRVFMVANNQSIIYDIEANTETILPDIPNSVCVTNPIDGSAILLPLSPPDFIPEVLVCGGTATDTIDSERPSTQTPALTQCSWIKLTEEGIMAGWQVEQMLEGRTMPELLHLPNGQILITNGGSTGADNTVLMPLYTPSLPLGRRISNKGMPTTNIPRMYHSSITLTPQGNFLIAGSSPNGSATMTGVKFPSEFRVETLDPPFMNAERPKLVSVPKKLAFGQKVSVPISIPRGLRTQDIKVSLMDLGFSTHAFHAGARLVFMDATISPVAAPIPFHAGVPLHKLPSSLTNI